MRNGSFASGWSIPYRNVSRMQTGVRVGAGIDRAALSVVRVVRQRRAEIADPVLGDAVRGRPWLSRRLNWMGHLR